jgi:hypothetical protein
MIKPEPILSNISSKFPPSFGIIPQIIKHDFCKEKGSKGSFISCKSDIEEYSIFSSISFDSNIIFFSFIFSMITSTGLLLFNKIGAFKTIHPFSKQ